MASTWNQGQWNLGSWSDSSSGSAITGLLANTALNSVTIDAQINEGWGRSTWNSATWNSAPSAFVSVTGSQTTVEIDLGIGWGRGTWSEDGWNTPGGYILTGTGTLFSITGQQGTTAIFDADNVTFPNATISAQAALLYNANNANSAIAILDFGGVKTSTNGTFELQFPTANASAGLIRIA